MAFRFVHTADLHLDSPLRSLSLRNPDLAALIGDASRAALTAIVDLCLAERVDALLLAGDLYDGDQTSMKTARFLAAELARLDAAGISTFQVRGNHDALSRLTRELVLPPSVTVFGEKPGLVRLAAGGLEIAVHGISFSRPEAPESLLPRFAAPLEGAVNIGLLHTSLGGTPGHDIYAPCSPAELHATGFRYWALGHIHQRAVLEGAATIVMPGIPQGRDINEAGEKSVSLVTLSDDGAVRVEARRTSVAEFARVPVDVSGLETRGAAVDAIGRALEAARADAASPHLVARLALRGATPLSFALRRDADLLLQDADLRAGGIGGIWVEKLGVETRDARAGSSGASADPVAELGALMRGEIAGDHGLRDAVRRLARETIDDLPPELRGLAGEDEAGFEAFVAELLEEGGQDVLARLAAAGTEPA
ncbi:DNA repair exonuclease [Aurantimonas sp. Leaf443]|uniref:metallophosphoesterase family protein n=1 Tax=Aurantimonas sp. Leaf443 TaxID=1736378 RepID=UPI000701E5DC|nr:DNA repair exonuclease [Aurantimonas sp. Leaf443]KQT87156.1 serine/threonine protein phosphatase [Aurantimonas sp. Leaf443]